MWLRMGWHLETRWVSAERRFLGAAKRVGDNTKALWGRLNRGLLVDAATSSMFLPSYFVDGSIDFRASTHKSDVKRAHGGLRAPGS